MPEPAVSLSSKIAPLAVAVLVVASLACRDRLGEQVEAFYDAVGRGDVAAVKASLAENPGLARIRADTTGRSAVHMAAARGQLALLEVLVEGGAVLTEKDPVGHTPLHQAAASGKAEAVRWLLARESDVRTRDNDGDTPLHDAAASELKVVELLLDAGAPVQERNARRQTPLHRVQTGNLYIAAALCAAGADPYAVDEAGLTPERVVRTRAEEVRPGAPDVAATDDLLAGWLGNEGPCARLAARRNAEGAIGADARDVALEQFLCAHGDAPSCESLRTRCQAGANDACAAVASSSRTR